MSRRSIVLATAAALLLLDLGRSVYARIGFATPLENYQPDAAVAAELSWPPGADLGPQTPAGQRVYAQHCAVCHGPDGRGNGPAAPGMVPHPLDFSRGQFKYTSVSGGPPTDDDLRRVVTSGLPSSPMPFWSDVLSPEEIVAVVDQVKRFSPAFAGPPPVPITVPPRVPPDTASVSRGRDLFTTRGCLGCHGADGRGQNALTDSTGHLVFARDLTAPWTFRGGSAPEQVWLRLTTGLAPSPMPSIASATTPEERWDLVNYVSSLARVPAWEPGGKLDGARQQADLVKRGSYLVHAQMCDLCHTQLSATGVYRADTFRNAGGMRVIVYPHGSFVVPNITSDPETGIGSQTEAEIAASIRNGLAPNRALDVLAMPWVYFHSLRQDDAIAIARYLKTTPAVHNAIPAPLHYGVVEAIVTHIAFGLPSVAPERLAYGAGNFGQSGSAIGRELPQTVLIGVQALVLIAGAIAFVMAAPAARRFPRSQAAWVKGVLGAIGFALLAFVGWILYSLPAVPLIPPEQIVNNSPAAEAPDPDTTMLSLENAALVQAGRNIFISASCLYCHSTNASGGLKMSWKPVGSIWSGNLTSDTATGTGAWTDAQLARAIRSGVSKDGRALHWSAMPWDKFATLDEEDIRALIAYLRAIPPVVRVTPTPRPPAADDCTEQTFYIRGILEVDKPIQAMPGC